MRNCAIIHPLHLELETAVLDLISTVKTGPGTLRFGVENLLNSQYYLPVAQLQRAGPASLTAARGMLISLGYSMTW
jgi:iron complex outermembrane receptor protein